MKLRTIYALLTLALLLGCEDLEIPNADQFVIEAFITAGQPINDIKIKETASLDADSLPDVPITGAEVRLLSGGEEVFLNYNPETKKYYAEDSDFEIVNFEEYSIEIRADGTTATATTVVPEPPTGLQMTDSVLIVPQLFLTFGLREQIEELFANERITLTWDSIPGRSFFVVIERKEDEPDQILPAEVPAESLELLSSFRFISEPSPIPSFDIIAVALEGYGRHIAKVYTVNEEYVDLFNSAVQDSRDLNEPPSNIANGLGIFTAFAVDSLEFELRRN